MKKMSGHWEKEFEWMTPEKADRFFQNIVDDANRIEKTEGDNHAKRSFIENKMPDATRDIKFSIDTESKEAQVGEKIWEQGEIKSMSKLDRAAILAMEPGRELNDLITHEFIGREGEWSTDIAAAWEVKNKMRSYEFDHPLRRKFYTILWDLVDDYLEVDPHHIVKAALIAKLESEG